MISKLINCSVTPLISRVNYSLYHKFESLRNNNKPAYQRVYEIQRTYFNNKLEGIEPTCKQIISEILQKPNEVAKHQQLLSRYLDVHASVNKIKSARDLLILLIAINMNKASALSGYNKSLFQHLIRNKVQEVAMDAVMLKYFLQVVHKMLTMPLQKAKYQYILYTYLNIVKANLELVYISEYYHLIDLITSQKKNRLYFLKFALHLQQFLIKKYYLPCLEGKSEQKVQNYMKNPSHIISTVKLMNFYSCTQQNGQIMYQFIDKLYLKDKMVKGMLTYDFISKLYRYYPYVTQDSQGVLYKSKMRQQIIAYLESKNIQQFLVYPKYVSIFCSTIVHQMIYQKWMNLSFSQIGDNVFLQKDELKDPPTLPNYFWQLYSHKSEEINSVQILGDVIKTLYPTKFIENKHKNKNQRSQPLSQTEMRIRMQIVLTNLKIEYKKEVYVEGRFIDFILEDRIALQLDGLLHFDPYHFKMDQKTSYRNIHLLYAGYKIIVINIHEYNLNREVPELTKLLQQKLAIMKQYDCLAVL